MVVLKSMKSKDVSDPYSQDEVLLLTNKHFKTYIGHGVLSGKMSLFYRTFDCIGIPSRQLSLSWNVWHDV